MESTESVSDEMVVGVTAEEESASLTEISSIQASTETGSGSIPMDLSPLVSVSIILWVSHRKQLLQPMIVIFPPCLGSFGDSVPVQAEDLSLSKEVISVGNKEGSDRKQAADDSSDTRTAVHMSDLELETVSGESSIAAM